MPASASLCRLAIAIEILGDRGIALASIPKIDDVSQHGLLSRIDNQMRALS